MFDTSIPTALPPPAAGLAAAAVHPGQFPLELELEFAESQAVAPAAGTLPAVLGAALLFHAMLIAERATALFAPAGFAVRGVPVTALLLAFLLVPARVRKADAGRAFLVLFPVIMIAALLAGVAFAGAGQLLPAQTGVALLVLLFGWLTALPRGWTALVTGSALLADAASLLLGPSAHVLGRPLILESMWAPGFAAALLMLHAAVRHNEARREFLLLRQAAFAGVPQALPAGEQSRHLDPETGVENRLAFDMRLRAAWDQAATRRNSVALLFFSIDNFAEHKRDHGYKVATMLQCQVAGLLKDSLRRSDDMVARFDTHHFVVMLPGVGTDGATQIAERLRGCVEQLAIYAGQKRYRATVTVGAASMRAKRATPREKLVDCAVQALEQARGTGPNTVCVEGRGCVPRMS